MDQWHPPSGIPVHLPEEINLYIFHCWRFVHREIDGQDLNSYVVTGCEVGRANSGRSMCVCGRREETLVVELVREGMSTSDLKFRMKISPRPFIFSKIRLKNIIRCI